MPPGFHHHGTRLGDVEPHHLQKDRIGTLCAHRNHDDLDSAEVEKRGRAEVHLATGIEATAANAFAISQANDFRSCFKPVRKLVAAVTIEHRVETRPLAEGGCFGGKRRVIDHSDDHILGVGPMERLNDPHRIAIATTSGIVGHVCQDNRRPARVIPDCKHLLHGLIERREHRRVAFVLGPSPVSNQLCRALRRSVRLPGADDDREAVLGRVAIGEAPEDRHVEHVVA